MTTPSLVVPVGTQVVSRVTVRDSEGEIVCSEGSVGILIAAPSEQLGMYRVRFVNGMEATLPRRDFSVRKHVQQSGFAQPAPLVGGVNLYDYVIYRCVVGSRAYGLDQADSDVDRRGIYLPPADLQWSLAGVPEQLDNLETEETYWELAKFLTLALKANPNVLECLYSPLVESRTPIAEKLLRMRDIFLSRTIYQTYNGYVLSQFKKLEQDLRTHGALKWKHAMHLIRLLLSGITALNEGFVPLRVERYRDRLLEIRRGEVPWEEVNAWRLSLHRELDAAFATTRLPDRPDFAAANALLVEARRTMVTT